MKDCVFCKIMRGEIPSYKIFEDELTFAFLDLAQDFFGHILVVPKKHVENVLSENFDRQTAAAVMATITKISNHLKTKGFDGVNILNASGAAAQQSVFHLHFHIIPRKENDGLKVWPNAATKRDLAKELELLKMN